jgi:hypothetical protein
MATTFEKCKAAREFLTEIYWNRGYVTEEQFIKIESFLEIGGTLRSAYEPDAMRERDPDVLLAEIKHLQRIQVNMQNQMAKIYKELKEKR